MSKGLENLLGQFRAIGILDIIDILVVAYLIYQLIKLVRETRAIQLVKGILALLAIYAVSHALTLQTMTFIMRNIIQIGAFAMVVVFQPELRRALEQVGRTRLSSLGGVFGSSALEDQQGQFLWRKAISSICDSCASLSRQKIGALIVLERETPLGDVIKTGTIVDADPSIELIINIFFPNSPLHDGALIMRRGKLYAAGCFLPLSDNFTISKELGTRHRAALGISENSDALVVVVSEETGKITLADNGKLKRGLSIEELGQELRSAFIVEHDQNSASRRPGFWKVKKNEKN